MVYSFIFSLIIKFSPWVPYTVFCAWWDGMCLNPNKFYINVLFVKETFVYIYYNEHHNI